METIICINEIRKFTFKIRILIYSTSYMRLIISLLYSLIIDK